MKINIKTFSHSIRNLQEINLFLKVKLDYELIYDL